VDGAREGRNESATRRSLWRHGDFMRLWTGQSVSLLGSQVTLLALPLTAILLFHATAFQVGALSAVEFLPFMLFGLPVGVLVDRMRRRPILIAADAGRFVAIGSIPLAHALGMLHLGQLYVVAFIFGTGTVFFDVAYLAYLPALVPRDRLVEGNAKLEVSRSGAQLAGPGIAGVLVQALSAPGAMLADAVSYLASVASLSLVRTKEPPVGPEGGSPIPMRRQIGEGLRYVRHQPLIGPLVVCVAILNFFSMMGEAVLLLFAVRRLGLSAGAIGVILSVGSVGFVVGALVAERLPRVFGIGPALLGTAFMVGLGAVFIPLSTVATAPYLLVAYGLISTFGSVVFSVNARSLMQSVVPPRLLGRAFATHRFVSWSANPLGALVGGLLGSHLGLRGTLWLAAAGQLVAFIPPLLSPVRRLVQLPEHDESAQVPLGDGTPISGRPT
jgi:MFS family permease